MKKWVLLACALVAGAARAETAQEQMQRLYDERIEIYFKSEDLKRQIAAAEHDPGITSEAVAAARKALDLARQKYQVAEIEVAALEREGLEVPENMEAAWAKAAEDVEAATAKLRETLAEHPKVKAMSDELKKLDARAKVLKAENDALKEKQQQSEKQ
ncbi:MAG: hypothetical protein FWF96_00930 [Kiritimatiellaeota bacterium]|nr:hypothetical protein [Kiritimatiellota bacterium]